MQRSGVDRTSGACLVVGGIVAFGCNIALPHDDDDFAFIELVGRSDSWPWLHAGLFASVILVMVGLYRVIELGRADRPHLASLASGALLLGGGFMLSGLVVAGVALRKSADNVLFLLREKGSGPDLSGSFFSALGFDRLAYSLYAAAAVLLLGMVPIAVGLGLWRSTGTRVLGIAGLAAGVLSVITGLVGLIGEIGTLELYLASSLAVTLWVIATGLALLSGHLGETTEAHAAG